MHSPDGWKKENRGREEDDKGEERHGGRYARTSQKNEGRRGAESTASTTYSKKFGDFRGGKNPKKKECSNRRNTIEEI